MSRIYTVAVKWRKRNVFLTRRRGWRWPGDLSDPV